MYPLTDWRTLGKKWDGYYWSERRAVASGIIPWQEILDAVDGIVGEAGEHVA